MLFKNRYIISIYNIKDEVIFICENSIELSKYLNQSLNSIRAILSRASKDINKTTSIVVNDKICNLYLIDILEEN